MRMQISITEMATDKYDLTLFPTPTDYNIQNPFAPSPSDASAKKALIPRQADLGYEWFVPDYKYPPGPSGTIRMCSRRRSCETEIALYWNKHQPETNGQYSRIPRSQFPNPLLLVDCSALFCAILRIQHRPDDLCGKLLLNHQRDLQTLLTISPIDTNTNLGDVEKKRAGSPNIASKFTISGLFALSFMGRRPSNGRQGVSGGRKGNYLVRGGDRKNGGVGGDGGKIREKKLLFTPTPKTERPIAAQEKSAGRRSCSLILRSLLPPIDIYKLDAH